MHMRMHMIMDMGIDMDMDMGSKESERETIMNRGPYGNPRGLARARARGLMVQKQTHARACMRHAGRLRTSGARARRVHSCGGPVPERKGKGECALEVHW